ncbi:MAG: antibiotic biosynthesis monooxygenase [Planctomycetales bacterium]|nr:antibiotic biosynthesis monooxygenase [Planctomycetales bacterium]MCA9168008.1 antibiotic biosynthesis monooxygenase [Planctomycetales bacterium]
MIYVIATVELKPDTRDAFLQEFRQIVSQVLAEEGCLEYGPTIDVETHLAVQPPARVDAVTIVEKWHDMACLEAHLVAPHMMSYRERVKPYVEKVTLQVLQPV